MFSVFPSLYDKVSQYGSISCKVIYQGSLEAVLLLTADCGWPMPYNAECQLL